MKVSHIAKTWLTTTFVVLFFNQTYAQVGIGTSIPHNSAQLEVVSANKGFLMPRLTKAQREAMATPIAAGLLVYQTDNTPGFYYYDGVAWNPLNPVSWRVTGNAGTTTNHFIGTTDAQPLRFRVNNQPSGYIGWNNDLVGLGIGALASQAGSNSVAFGSKALFSNKAQNNSAFGDQTLGALGGGVTGNANTAIGAKALAWNAGGWGNNAFGVAALYYNHLGEQNTAIGYSSLYNNFNGSANIGIGSYALLKNSTGWYNIAIGQDALKSIEINSENVSIGAYSSNAISGIGNTAIGHSALSRDPHGTVYGRNVTAIGAYAGAFNNLYNATAIGYGAVVDVSNRVKIGNANVTSIGGAVEWSVISDGRFKEEIKEDVPGLAFIKSLRPVTYTVNRSKLEAYYRKRTHQKEIETNVKTDISRKKRETGFIAQEVEKAAKALGYDFSGIDAPDNDTALYGLRYAEFVVPLVKAVKEQQLMIEKLQSENEVLKEQHKELLKRIEKIENE